MNLAQRTRRVRLAKQLFANSLTFACAGYENEGPKLGGIRGFEGI